MDVRVHGSNVQVPDDIKELAETKVSHAGRMFDNVAAADVEFSAEKNPRITNERFRVEITASAAGHLVRVESAEFDERAALEVAVDKFERQLRKLKGRLIARNRRTSEKHLNDPAPVDEEEEASALRIERFKQFVVKPMTPEEAALQMDSLGHSFFFFLNAETDRYSVLYRRRGGSMGLIEPE